MKPDTQHVIPSIVCRLAQCFWRSGCPGPEFCRSVVRRYWIQTSSVLRSIKTRLAAGWARSSTAVHTHSISLHGSQLPYCRIRPAAGSSAHRRAQPTQTHKHANNMKAFVYKYRSYLQIFQEKQLPFHRCKRSVGLVAPYTWSVVWLARPDTVGLGDIPVPYNLM